MSYLRLEARVFKIEAFSAKKATFQVALSGWPVKIRTNFIPYLKLIADYQVFSA
jgi:hypothetical protein